MKDFFKLKKSKLLLFTLLAMMAGASPAWAETLTTDFNDGLPEGWSIVGDLTNDDTRARSGKGIWTSSKSTTDNYVITEVVDGTFEFYARAYNKSYASTVVVYEYSGSGLGTQLYTTGSMYTSSTPSWSKYSFTIENGTQVALVLNYAAIDDVTYTQYVAVSCPKPKALTATDVTDESAVLGWTSDADTWNLRYKAEGNADYTVINGITESPYTLTGLDGGMNYTFQLQAVCSADDQSDWSTAGSFTTPICNPSAQENISYTLTDSYGDGWNGAKITITDVQASIVIAELTLSSGNSANGTVALCPNREYSFTWTKGSYDGECSYTIKDVDGNDLYTLASNSSPSDGQIGTYIWGDAIPVGANFAINTDGSTQDFGSVKVNATAEKTFTVTNSGNADLSISFASDGDFSVVGYENPLKTFKLTDNFGWETAYVYAWDSEVNNLLGGWPGTPAETTTNDYGETQFVITVPENAIGVIVNNGNDAQTEDITNFNNYDGYWMDGKRDDMGHYLVTGYIEDTPSAAATLTVAAGGYNTFTVTMNTETPGDKSGSVVLTFDALNATSFTIPCTGNVKDPNLLMVDFEDPNSFPEGWQVGADWTVGSASSNHYAAQSNTKTPSAIVTTPLTVAENGKLTFKVARNLTGSASYTKSLKARYSADGGVNWSDYVDYGDDFGSSFAQYELTNVPTGTVIVEFFGNNIKIDDIEGLRLATKPALAITESDAAVTNGDTKDFGNLSADGTATYTVKNIGNATLTASITGEYITFSPSNIEIAAGQTADITVTMAYAQPYGERTGMKMTIDSEDSWISDFVVNFTANLVDPSDFVIDFESGKPAGWYFDTWNVTNGMATINVGNPKPMITEKFGAESGKNVLSFDAKMAYDYETGAPTLSVYTSPDRKTWTLAKTCTLETTSQTFSLSALDNGNYYVKFESNNASVDNIKGVKKLELPAHDLYLVEANLPTDQISPVDTYTATVKVASLVADETVAAELYFGDTKVGELTNETIANGATKTFIVTGTAPDAGTFEVYAKVYNNNISVETEKVSVTVEDKTELSLTGFDAVTTAVQANENNEFAAEFNVTVKNTGSKALTADQVSVTVTDLDKNEYETATWTPGETIYLKAGNYTDDNANIAIYRWSTETDSEWALFTEGTNGIYSAELNGKTNFIICRVDPDVAVSGLSFNEGVCWNKSGDLTTAQGVVFENNGYNDNVLNLTQGNNFIAGMSATITVTVTADAGNGGEFNFNVRENVSDAYWYSSLGDYKTVNVTAASAIVLNETSSEPFATGNNRKVRLNHTFVAGWNTICLPFAITPDEIASGAKALEFTAYNAETNELTFSPATELAANKPYAIWVENAITEPIEFTGKDVATSDELGVTFSGVTFQGTYSPMAAGSLTSCYGLTAAGKIAKASEATTMKGFRAYFSGLTAGARVMFLNDDTQGISTISMETAAPEGTYNMQGQKVEQLRKGGIYIINGKKQIVK